MPPHSRLPAKRRCLSSCSRSRNRVRSAPFCAARVTVPSSPVEGPVYSFDPQRRLSTAAVGPKGAESAMATPGFDISELKRRMQGATQSLKHELGGLRTGRAAASMLEPVQGDAYGSHMPLNQLC